MNFKLILILAVCIICLIAGYYICDRFNKPSHVIVTNTIIENVDSTNIIQKSRIGYIKLADAKKKFGKIITDTIFVYLDSVITKDSTIYSNGQMPIKYMKSDTTLIFTKHTKTDSLEVILELKQTAYLEPLYLFEDSIKLLKLTHSHIDTLQLPVLNKTGIKDKATWFMIGAGSLAILTVISRIL